MPPAKVVTTRRRMPPKLERLVKATVRKFVPASLERALRIVLGNVVPSRLMETIAATKTALVHESQYVNIYHCCVQKTASRWLRRILSDARTVMYSGLKSFDYESGLPGGSDPRRLTERTFDSPFSEQTVVGPLYVDYPGFTSIPKPERYRALFVMRDPRDIVVSWYFSARHSHVAIGTIPELRRRLADMSLGDGLLWTIDYLRDRGLFEALRSWIDVPKRDRNVRVFRFEEMTAPDNVRVFRDMFAFCDIPMPEDVLRQALEDISFKRLSGRKLGKEDTHSHYRKGTPGDWRNHFDSHATRRFKEAAGDLVEQLRYESDPGWGVE